MTRGPGDEWLMQLADDARSQRLEVESLWIALDKQGLLSKVRVARYICAKRCSLIDVIRLGDVVLAKTRNYKLRPRTNDSASVASARATKTLDGERHWPGKVFNAGVLAGQVDPSNWGHPASGSLRLPANCHHAQHVVDAASVLTLIKDVKPGHPGAPIILT